jgi:hypothetical protein
MSTRLSEVGNAALAAIARARESAVVVEDDAADFVSGVTAQFSARADSTERRARRQSLG